MIDYRAVGNRCAVFSELFTSIGVTHLEALRLLKGFRLIKMDVLVEARACIGQSRYERGARPSFAPRVVDCSSLMKWVYGQAGIWLPRRSIQQRECGVRIALSDARAGDLVFTEGYKNYYKDDPADGVGHVGLLTEIGTVIHAADRRRGVVETSFEEFAEGEFRGAVSIVSDWSRVYVLETPEEREVETSDDIRWILMQSLS